MSEVGLPDQFSSLIKRLETPTKSLMTQTEMWQERYAAATVIRILVKELERCRETFDKIAALADPGMDVLGSSMARGEMAGMAKQALAFLNRLPLL